jgi:hypothetical protein
VAADHRLDVARPEADPGARTLPPRLTLATSTPEPQFARNYALNKRLISEIAAVCTNAGVELLLFNLDSAGYSPQSEAKLRALDATFDAFFFERDLERFANELGVDYLSLQTAFRAASRDGLDLHWVHWTYAGHRVVAEALTNKLVTILPAR